MTLTYRLFEERDLTGILRLWEEDSGWGGLTPEIWLQWVNETPNGPCLVVVAEDEAGEIAAQGLLSPSRIVVGDAEERALRLTAPILRRDQRRLSLRNRNHPTLGLLLTGTEAGIQQGYTVIYSLPERGWLSFFRGLSRFGLPAYETAEYGCVELSLADASRCPAGVRSLTASRTGEFGADFDRLWQQARARLPVHTGVMRSADWLRFRNSANVCVEVRDPAGGELEGFAVIRPRDGLIVDALACEQAAMTPVLAAALRWLAEQSGADGAALETVKAMETDVMRPALRALGFSPVEYRFAFVSCSLVARIPAMAIAPSAWYLTPGD